MSVKPFGDELFLNTNNGVRLTNLNALAQTIQNLCIIEPGTLPNDPELGLGIENEQFEILDNSYLDELKNRLENQIERFIDTDEDIAVNVSARRISATDQRKVLIIELLLGKRDKSNSDTSGQVDLLFMKNSNGKLISKVMI